MTIAAGFRVREGVVVCADTQYTGLAKVHQTKVFGYEFPGAPQPVALTFALAGHEVYGKMAIEQSVEAVEDIPTGQRSLRAVRTGIQRAIRKVQKDYVDTRPDAAERDLAKFELVIGAWLPLGGGFKLFRSIGGGLVEGERYEFVGVGAYLGEYLMRRAFSPDLAMRDALLFAARAIAAAKDHDTNCGGESHFLVIGFGGKISGLGQHDVRHSEQYIADYETISNQILCDLANPDIDDAEFSSQLRGREAALRRLRDRWNKDTKSREAFRDMAERIREALSARSGPLNPEQTTVELPPLLPSPE